MRMHIRIVSRVLATLTMVGVGRGDAHVHRTQDELISTLRHRPDSHRAAQERVTPTISAHMPTSQPLAHATCTQSIPTAYPTLHGHRAAQERVTPTISAHMLTSQPLAHATRTHHKHLNRLLTPRARRPAACSTRCCPSTWSRSCA